MTEPERNAEYFTELAIGCCSKAARIPVLQTSSELSAQLSIAYSLIAANKFLERIAVVLERFYKSRE